MSRVAPRGVQMKLENKLFGHEGTWVFKTQGKQFFSQLGKGECEVYMWTNGQSRAMMYHLEMTSCVFILNSLPHSQSCT